MRQATNQVCWVPIQDIVDEGGELHGGDTLMLSRRGDGRYTLLSGQRRLTAAREQGLSCVDAVLSPPDMLEGRIARLLDKLVRDELHFEDEAEEYRSLLSDGISAEELAVRLGRNAATIRRRLRLLNLGDEVMAELRRLGLREGYAQELLRVPGIQGRKRVLKHIAEGGLSVKETEKLIDGLLARMPVPVTGGRRLKPAMRDYRLYLNAIRGIVEQMRDAGLDASMTVTMGKRVAETRIVIPLLGAAMPLGAAIPQGAVKPLGAVKPQGAAMPLGAVKPPE